MPYFFSITIIVAFTFSLCSQVRETDFSIYTTDIGLSNNQVNAIVQDKMGFLWIGTNDGLNRFDGKNFKLFKKESTSHGLGGNTITDIALDKDQSLWIATQDGGITHFSPYHPSGVQIKIYRHVPGDSTTLPTDFITSLLLDDQGLLWLGTEGQGVLAIEKTTGKIKHHISVNARNIIKLFEGPNHEIWVGRQGGGLLKIDAKTGKASQDVRYLDFYRKLPHMVITAFMEVEGGHWIGSWDKDIYWIKSDGSEEKVLRNQGFEQDVINTFLDTKEMIWIGGEKGLQVYHKKEKKIMPILNLAKLRYPTSASNIRCMIQDKDHQVWIGTSRGLLHYSPSTQDYQQYFVDENMEATILDIDFHIPGMIRMATDKGLYFFDKKHQAKGREMYRVNGKEVFISKLITTSDGKSFAGTNTSLYRFENNKLIGLANTEADGVMNNIIASKVTDIEEACMEGKEVLLAVPYGHYFSLYDLVNRQWSSRLSGPYHPVTDFGVKDNLVKDILVDGNKIVFSTVKNGIVVFDSGKIKILNTYNSPSLQSNHISQVIRYPEGYLISTFGGGIYATDHNFNKLHHLPLSPNLCEGINYEGGLLWIIANGGLYYYDLQKAYLNRIRLPDIYASGGVRGRIYSDHRGTLYVSGKNYFIPVSTQQDIDTTTTSMVITDVKIGNVTVPFQFGRNLFVPYNQNNLKFEFSVPFFLPGEHIQYAYRIRELGGQWNEIGSQQVLEFFHMQSGKYHLEFRFSRVQGEWIQHPEVILFEIGLPFYRQLWFILLVFTLLGLILYWGYRNQLHQQQIQHDIRNKISQDLHDQVGATLTGINIYAKLAKKLTSVDHQGNMEELLDKIFTSSQTTLTDINDIVWAINPQNDTMDGMVNRMKVLLQNLLPPKGIQYTFDYQNPSGKNAINMSVRKNLFLIFRETINNIVKHSECKHTTIRLFTTEDHLTLQVEDDGIGFNVNENQSQLSMSGNGLKNLKNRAWENHGSADVFSQPGIGSKIIVKFKI